MVFILIILVITTAFAIGGLLGAPYVPILRRDTTPLLELAGLKSGQTLIDLGSGDGQLLRAAAKRGIRCIGFEINPIMVLISRLVCWRYRRLITIHLANFWNTKLPPADVIYVFLIPKHMARLDHFLSAQITKPTRVISYIFEFPGRKAQKRGANALVYDFGQS